MIQIAKTVIFHIEDGKLCKTPVYSRGERYCGHIKNLDPEMTLLRLNKRKCLTGKRNFIIEEF